MSCMKATHDHETKQILKTSSILAQARAKSGMTLQDVYRKSGIFQANVSRLENGLSSPKVEFVARLGKTYSLTLSEVLGGPRVKCNDWCSVFAKNVHKLVSKSDRSYRDLASDMGIDVALLHRFATGQRVPSLKTLTRVAIGFNKEPHELVTRNGARGKRAS